MDKGFDLSAFLGDVSDLNTSRKQIEYIAMDLLLADPNNRYELSGIDELAANIEMFGLQQPLEVRPCAERPGMYTVTSGHRRRAALEQLGMDEAPCIVVEPMGSEALQELRLIFANSDTRRMSPAELAWQAERVRELFYQLKEEGYEFPGRMRDHVAAALKVSKSKLARLEAIRNNLKAPGLVEAYEAGKLSEATAYELSKCSEAVQDLADEMPEYFCAHTTEEAIKVIYGLEREAALDAQPEPEPKINTAPVPTTSGYDARKKADEYLATRFEEDQKYFKLITKVFGDFIARAPVMGIDRGENVASFKAVFKNSAAGSRAVHWSGYGNGITVSSLDDKIPGIARSWSAVYDMVAALAINFAKQELTKPVPKINTKPEWQTGDPENEGKYYCKIELEGVSVHQTLIYNKGWKLLSGGHDLDEACRVIGWWPLPEE